MSHSGAYTLAQDEASCVVFGMPRQAIAAGGVREVISLADIPARLEALAVA
jgi:two-component system, chemotaxis family, protein-glutamate methylesterase/glutaminase